MKKAFFPIAALAIATFSVPSHSYEVRKIVGGSKNSTSSVEMNVDYIDSVTLERNLICLWVVPV